MAATQSLPLRIPGPANPQSRGHGHPLAIPLDELPAKKLAFKPATSSGAGVVVLEVDSSFPVYNKNADTSPSKHALEPRRRDSLKRRDAVLKGKEGSRRRQRWENDRLLSNPHAQPPQPSDWEIHPTCPRHGTVPYYLAPLWDLHFAPAAAQAAAARHRRATAAGAGSGNATAVPKQLRQTLKRARGAKTLLQTLEEQIRAFIAGSGDHGPTAAQQQQQELSDGEYSVVGAEDLESDEEIVVLGRDGEEDEKARVLGRARRSARKRLICEGLVEDQHASFGRWLVHSIADYYGLLTWSVTIGNPARREAYVGIRDGQNGQATSDPSMRALPRPLWVAL